MYVEKRNTCRQGVTSETLDPIFKPYFSVDCSRWFAGVIPALLVTLLLVVIMYRLVYTEFPELPAEESISFEPLFYQDRIVETRIDKKPTEPEKPKDPPSLPPPEIVDIGEADVSIPKISFNHNKIRLDGISGMSSMPVAAYLVSAKYPSVALSKGLEGYVDVGFDVNKAGITQNIHIVSAVPQGVFEKAALEAVRRWRYKPKMVDGKAEYFAGLSKRIRFELEE